MNYLSDLINQGKKHEEDFLLKQHKNTIKYELIQAADIILQLADCSKLWVEYATDDCFHIYLNPYNVKKQTYKGALVAIFQVKSVEEDVVSVYLMQPRIYTAVTLYHKYSVFDREEAYKTFTRLLYLASINPDTFIETKNNEQ